MGALMLGIVTELMSDLNAIANIYPDGEWGTSHYDGRVDEVDVEE